MLNPDQLTLNISIEALFTSNTIEMNEIGCDNVVIIPKQSFNNYFKKKKYFNDLFNKCNICIFFLFLFYS